MDAVVGRRVAHEVDSPRRHRAEREAHEPPWCPSLGTVEPDSILGAEQHHKIEMMEGAEESENIAEVSRERIPGMMK